MDEGTGYCCGAPRLQTGMGERSCTCGGGGKCCCSGGPRQGALASQQGWAGLQAGLGSAELLHAECNISSCGRRWECSARPHTSREVQGGASDRGCGRLSGLSWRAFSRQLLRWQSRIAGGLRCALVLGCQSGQLSDHGAGSFPTGRAGSLSPHRPCQTLPGPPPPRPSPCLLGPGLSC